MYKTIRHGENSLQYTILPQNDDFRIEGKLTKGARGSTSASSSSSAVPSSNTHKRSASAPRKRRSFFAYLGLIFVCTVIIGAVLIPFLVSAECLPNPADWFLRTKAALIHNAGADKHTSNGPAPQSMIAAAPTAASVDNKLVIGKQVQIINHNGVEQFILKLNKTASALTTTTAATTTTTSTTAEPTTMTTTPATTTSTRAAATPTILEATALPAAASVFAVKTAMPVQSTTALPIPAAPPLNSRVPASTITTRIIQVPLLKSAAKKPIIPPVLAKTQSTLVPTAAVPATEAVPQNKSNDWVNTHLAYIVPSTYLEWTGYNSEDSVLLPALLGFALIGMILIITVCLVARNKRTIVSSVRKRNRNDIEEQGAEDNATLLTTTNLSDDD